jgi:hypothetical protein
MSEHFCQISQAQLALAAGGLCRWPDNDLPWTLAETFHGLSSRKLVDILQPAFSKWDRMRVRFVDSSSQARLIVTTRKIDGPGRVLAECQLPCGATNRVTMWFDFLDNWDEETIFQVGWHECGHAIGLSHAGEGSKNIMAPFLDKSISQLGVWDRQQQAIRYIEIVPEPPPATPNDPPKPPAGGKWMSFLWELFIKMAKDQLQKWIDDGTLQRILEELLRRLLSGQIKDVEQLGAAATQAIKAP